MPEKLATMTTLLLQPPFSKPCEAPAPLAYLGAALRHAKLASLEVDLNLEAFYHLLQQAPTLDDPWSKRASKNLPQNLKRLRDRQGYRNHAQYTRTVGELNRQLANSGHDRGLHLSLGNYQDESCSPLRSADLLVAADNYQQHLLAPFFIPRLRQLLEDRQPSLVGISLSFLSQAITTFAILGYLKAEFPDLPVVLGGGLVSSWLSQPDFHNPFTPLVDRLVAGPGEDLLCQFQGRKGPAKAVPPDYHQLQQLPYLSPGFVLPYTTSRGCFWKKCSFCPETSEGNPFSQLEATLVSEELQSLCRTSKPSLIHLLDNAIPPATLRAMAHQPPGAPWYGFARITSQLTDLDFCRALKASGCVMLKLGLESGDQLVLDRMGKGIDLGVAAKVLSTLKAVGIATYVYLLFGTPEEDEAAAMRTLAFVEKHAEAITFLNLAIFNLPKAGGNLQGLEVEEFYDADLSLYHSFKHPAGWHRGKVRRFLDNEFKKRPKVSAILARDSQHFTSNHAPFLFMEQAMSAAPK